MYVFVLLQAPEGPVIAQQPQLLQQPSESVPAEHALLILMRDIHSDIKAIKENTKPLEMKVASQRLLLKERVRYCGEICEGPLCERNCFPIVL